MFLAEADDVIFSDERFASRKKIGINTEFLAFGYDFVHFLEGKIQSVAVFGCPASGAMQIACGRRIHKDNPRNVAAVFFLHFT